MDFGIRGLTLKVLLQEDISVMSLLEYLTKDTSKEKVESAQNQASKSEPEKKDTHKPKSKASTKLSGLDFKPLFAFTADWHLFKKQYNLNERITDIYNACKQIVNKLILYKVPLLIHGGDLFNQNVVRPLALKQAMDLLAPYCDTGSRVLVIRGNHDGNQIAASNQDTLLVNLQDSGFIDYKEHGIYQITINNQSFTFYCVSHYGKDTFKRIESLVQSNPLTDKTINVLICHILVDGMNIPNQAADVSVSALAKFGFDMILTGHCHKVWRNQKPDIYCPGSPETLSFNELQNERGFWIFGLNEDGSLVYRFEPILTRRFVTIDIDIGTADLETGISTCKSIIDKHDIDSAIVRIKITGTLVDALAKDFPVHKIKAMCSKAFYVAKVSVDVFDAFSKANPSPIDNRTIFDDVSAFKDVFKDIKRDDIDSFIASVISIKDELISKNQNKVSNVIGAIKRLATAKSRVSV